MEPLEKCYTPVQVAERYGVSWRTIHRWIRNGWMTALDLGAGGRVGPYAIRAEDLDAFEAARATMKKLAETEPQA